MRSVLTGSAICASSFLVFPLWADDCEGAADAAIAQAKVPHAVTPPVRDEMVFIENKAYSQIEGAWRSMPFKAQDQIEMATESQKRYADTPHKCQKTAGDPINGVTNSLLTLSENVKGKTTEVR